MKKSFVVLLFYLILFVQGGVTLLPALELTPIGGDDAASSFFTGRRGAFSGTVDGLFVTAGGVKENGTPDTAIFAAEKKGKNEIVSALSETVLPEGTAFGASVSTGNHLYLIGGIAGDDRVPSSRCYLISRSKETGALSVEETAPVPQPIVGGTASCLNGVLYLAGADAAGNPVFLKYDTAAKEPVWELLDPYPSEGRIFSAGTIQNISTGKAFFLFGGLSAACQKQIFAADGDLPALTSDIIHNPQTASYVWMYDFQKKTWCEWTNADGVTIEPLGSAAVPSGTLHIVFPGIGGILPASLDSLVPSSSEVHVLNTITHKFFTLGNLPGDTSPVGTPAFWNGHVTMPVNVAGAAVLSSVTLEEKTNRLSKLNQVIIAAYFVFLIAASLYFLSRMRGADDFFRGGCRIPWWALGISIYGTITSAITYITVPAKSFMTDWCYLLLAVGPFVAVPILIWFYVPKISRFNFTSAYEYLEYRFHYVVRILGSSIFIIFQVMRIAILLFLPSIALNAITGIDIKTCILGVGLAGIFCTLLGGLEIVVWIEVIQIITLLIGFVLTLIVIVWRFDGSLFDMLQIAYADGKLHLYDAAPDFHLPTLWVVLIASFFLYIIPYASDQTILQRYFAGKDNKARSRGVWISLGLMVPNLLLLFLAGTLFYVFYKENPKELLVTMNNNDSLMPWFFVSQLPNGLSGCLLLALFTSAMSSVSSGINAISATYTIDFHVRTFHFSQKHTLATARVVTFLSGLCGILFALAMATWDIASLWDQYNLFIGLVSSSLAGIFFLGVFCKRANTPGVLIGLAVSCCLQYYIAKHNMVHLLLYSGTGLVTTWFVGWLASYLFPKKILVEPGAENGEA